MLAGNLRELRHDDLPDALELSRLAGWNQTRDDWELLLRLDPQGCFGMEVEHHIVVATTTLLCYGQQLAWIGMVLTKPDYRRMGFARRLMQAALERSASLKIASVKLDATADGQPLYEKLGFTTEQIVERWFRDADQCQINETRSRDGSSAAASKEMDREAFGADRSEVLHELAQRNPPVATPEAFSFSRAGSRSRYLGPCIAADQRTARNVIEQTLRASPESSWYWDILATNEKAVALAQEFGFVRQRRLERMVLGGHLTTNDQLVYAIAGFELG